MRFTPKAKNTFIALVAVGNVFAGERKSLVAIRANRLLIKFLFNAEVISKFNVYEQIQKSQ